MIRHRFRVHRVESKAGIIYPLTDEHNCVWVKGHQLGTFTAVYDMPEVMAKSEAEAWAMLPTEGIEIVPTETKLAHVQFIYKEGNDDWTTSFEVAPEDVQTIVQKVETEKQGWVVFDRFSGEKQLINLSEVTRINIRYD